MKRGKKEKRDIQYKFKVSKEEKLMLEMLAQRMGVSCSDIVRLGIREMRKRELEKEEANRKGIFSK